MTLTSCFIESLSVSTAVLRHCDQKQSCGEKGLLGLYFHITVHNLGKSRQELK